MLRTRTAAQAHLRLGVAGTLEVVCRSEFNLYINSRSSSDRLQITSPALRLVYPPDGQTG